MGPHGRLDCASTRHRSSCGDGQGASVRRGNGRSTRLLADLVFLAAQDTESLVRYDWDLDRRRYVDLLREYDLHRDPTGLAAFIGTKPLGE